MNPMTVGEILTRSFRAYRSIFLPIYFLNLVPQLFLVALGLPMQKDIAGMAEVFKSGNPSPDQLIAVYSKIALPLMVIALVGLLLTAFRQGAMVLLASRHITGNDISFSEAIWGTVYRYPRLLGFVFLTSLAEGIGTLLCCLPGIALTLVFFIGLPAIVIADRGVFGALRACRELQFEHEPDEMHPLLKTLLVCGILLAVAIAAATIGQFPALVLGLMQGIKGSNQLPLAAMTAASVFQATIVALVAPLAAIASVVLFYDLSIRRHISTEEPAFAEE